MVIASCDDVKSLATTDVGQTTGLMALVVGSAGGIVGGGVVAAVADSVVVVMAGGLTVDGAVVIVVVVVGDSTTMLVVPMVAGCVDDVSDVDVSVAGGAMVVSDEATSDDGGPVVPVSKDPIKTIYCKLKMCFEFQDD